MKKFLKVLLAGILAVSTLACFSACKGKDDTLFPSKRGTKTKPQAGIGRSPHKAVRESPWLSRKPYRFRTNGRSPHRDSIPP